jgi:hypothetical protein
VQILVKIFLRSYWRQKKVKNIIGKINQSNGLNLVFLIF